MRVLNIEDLEDDYVLKDGEAIRVPMTYVCDSVAIDPAAYAAFYDNLKDKLVDAANHRSRSAVYTADQQKAREAAQAAYDRRISRAYLDAWQTGSNLHASELTPAQEEMAKAEAAQYAAERAASPNAGYDRRVSNAWRNQPPPIKDSGATKLSVITGAMASQTVEAGFKAATAMGEPVPLEQARARYHAKLEAGWRNAK